MAPDDPPNDPGAHFRADTQARWVGNGAKPTPGYKDDIQRLCSPGRGPNKESFIDKVYKGHLRNTTPANRDALRGRYHAGIMCERPPVIDPCVPGNNAGGRLIFKRRLRDCAMPMPR
ncbi:MAG: hypothetical protein GDA36_01755 [Rhodobacteraceae bacterium]|nr:hypothetical protein [Paracoccaceae bacterium]